MFPGYVDISTFQPATVDWNAYVAWSKQVDGIARLACRASEGTGVGDAHYAAYVSGIRAVDPKAVVIHYHYAYPQYNSPQAEVDWMASQVSLWSQDIIMLDFEENAVTGTNADWVLAWLKAAELKFGKLGKIPVIYASLSMVQNRLQDSRLTRYPLILADWTGGTTPPPAPAPWKDLWAWQYTDNLAGVPGFGSANVDANFYLHAAPPKPVYTSNGMVISLQKSYQLMNPAESQDQCGPWTASELKHAGLPGQPPRGTVDDVHSWAVTEYTNYLGPDVTSNQTGSSIDNMHSFFHDAGYHYWDIGAVTPTSTRSHDTAEIIAALNAGYPVVVTVNEQSVIRPDGSNPYPWQPALGPVNHIFCIVGHTSDGYFLVADELNAGDAWPDKYKQSRLEIHWASVIGLVGPNPAQPWFAPIPSGDPLSWPAGFNGQNFGGNTVGVPTGWNLSPDGSTLTAKNGVAVHAGFKDAVLNASPQWNADNVPQVAEYHTDQVLLHRPDIGTGNAQPFRDDYLWWTPAKGVVREQELGLELFLRDQKISALSTNLSSVQAQLASVQTQLAACQAAGGGIPADLQAAVNQAVTDLQPFVK